MWKNILIIIGCVLIVLIVISIIVFEITLWIMYGNKPTGEIPLWVLWFLVGK